MASSKLLMHCKFCHNIAIEFVISATTITQMLDILQTNFNPTTMRDIICHLFIVSVKFK